MSKKINDKIIDDFNESYKIELDREKIYKSIQINQELDKEDKLNITVLKLRSLCKKLTISISVLVLCLIGVIGIGLLKNQEGNKQDDILTQEFKEYMVEYTGIRDSKLYNFIRNDSIEFYVYECKSKTSDVNYYFYKVNSEESVDTYKLIINNQNIQLINDCYGLLCEIQQDGEIVFSIDKNGVITDYKIK